METNIYTDNIIMHQLLPTFISRSFMINLRNYEFFLNILILLITWLLFNRKKVKGKLDNIYMPFIELCKEAAV